MASGTAKWLYRHSSQSVCPWNVRFARELPEESPFRPRAALAGKDTRQLAREILGMDMDAYRVAFRGSAMKRAKLPMMKRNAAVLLGNVGTADDVDVLTRALGDPDPLVREHAAWALIQIGSSGMVAPARPDPDPCDAELEGASGDAMLIPTPGSAT